MYLRRSTTNFSQKSHDLPDPPGVPKHWACTNRVIIIVRPELTVMMSGSLRAQLTSCERHGTARKCPQVRE